MTTTPRSMDARRMSGLLALAAAPTFAAMAVVTAIGAAPMALCTGSGPPLVDPMTAMYLLMSLFHLPPWLKRAPGRGRAAA
jgi:hypothetical protein